MARSRDVKPDFFTDNGLAECSPYTRLLLAGLWTIANKEERLDDRPKKAKTMVLLFDGVDYSDLLQQLHSHKFINRYQVSSDSCIQINSQKKHQNPHCKEAASEIPEPVENNNSTGQEQCRDDKEEDKKDTEPPQVIENNKASEKHHAGTVREPVRNNLNPTNSLNLIPDSLIPHTDSLVNIQATDATCEESEAGVHEISGRYVFEGNIVRLNHKGYETWKHLYPNIDLECELEKLGIEFSHEKLKNWFITASQKLSCQNKQALSKPTCKVANGLQSEGFTSKDYGKTEIPSWAQE